MDYDPAEKKGEDSKHDLHYTLVVERQHYTSQKLNQQKINWRFKFLAFYLCFLEVYSGFVQQKYPLYPLELNRLVYKVITYICKYPLF